MTDKQIALDIEFGYDDVSHGLNDIQRMAKNVLSQFLLMADGIAEGTTKIGQSAQKSIDPLQAIGAACNKVLQGVNNSLQMMERQVRQVDMSPLEKSADKYGEMIKKAQNNVAALYLESQKVNASEEQRLAITNKIADVQSNITKMQQAQGQIQAFSQQAEAQKRAADAQMLAMKEANEQARILLNTQKEQEKTARSIAQQAKELVSGGMMSHGLAGDVAKNETTLRQSGLKDWEKQADNFAQKMRAGNAEVQRLQELLASANITEEQRLPIEARISEAQTHLNTLLNQQNQIVAQSKLKQEALEAVDALKKLEQEEKDAARKATELANAQKQVGQSLVGLASEVRGPVVAMAASLDLLVGASFEQFMGLSDQMATFKAVAHATGDEVDYMVQKAKGLEGIPTEQAAKAAVALGRAGVQAREAADDLAILSKASIASGESLETVSTIALSTNRAFGQANSELAKTTDIILATANATSTSVAEVGAGMSQMASASHSTGQSLLNTAIAFGILRDAGVSVESSATGYKNVMLAFASPTEKARKELNLLTHSANGAKEIFQDNGHIKDFASVMADLKDRLSGLNDAAKVDALAKIFDKRALNVVLAYMNQTDEKIQQTTEEVKKFAGESERASQVMQESVGFQFRAMIKDFENFKDGLGEDVAPVLKTFIGLIRNLLHAYEDLSEPMKGVIAGGVLILAGFTSLLGLASQVAISVGGLTLAWNAYVAAQERVAAANILSGNTAKGAAFGFTTMAEAGTLAAGIEFVALTGGLAAVALGIWKVVDAYNGWQKAEEDRQANEGIAQSAYDQTAGANNAIRSTPDAKVTGVQARAASVNVGNDIRRTTEQISALKDYKDLSAEQKRLVDSINTTSDMVLRNQYSQQLEVNRQNIEETRKQLGSLILDSESTAADIDTQIQSSETKLKRLQGEQKRDTDLLHEKVGLKPKAPAAKLEGTEDGPGGDTEAEKAAAKADKAEVARLGRVFAQRESDTKNFIAHETAKIDKLKEFQQTTEKASNIYESFLGKQEISRIRGVGGNHAGVDLQAKADFEKQYGSQVHVPEAVRITSTNSSLPYGAEVAMQSLVDSRVTYILHHLSPGDVNKNIKVGQEFGAGDELGARVGGKAEIGVGPHWQGVHLHVEKYINGKLASIENDPNRSVTLSGSSKETAYRKEQMKNQIAVNALQEDYNAKLKIEADTKAKFGDQSLAYGAAHKAVTDAETKLTTMQGKEAEAARKAGEARKAAEEKTNQEIAKLREAHEQSVITLMEEGQGKIEEQRRAELAKNADDLNKALADTKLAVGADSKLKELYAQKDLDTQAKYNKALEDLEDKRVKASRAFDYEIQQNKINAMDGGIEKTTALIQFGHDKQMAAYNDQLKELSKSESDHKDEIAAIYALEAQAGIDNSKKLKEAVIQDDIDKAKFKKDSLKESLDEDQKAFESAIGQMIATKRKMGIGSDKAVGTLKSADVSTLADSLGQSSPDAVLASLRGQLKATEDIQVAQEKMQADQSFGSDAYNKSVKEIIASQQERADIQQKINLLSDDGFRKWIKNYQDVQKKTQEISDEHLRLTAILGGVTEVAQAIVGSFGDMGKNVASGLGTASGIIGQMLDLKNKFDNTAAKPGSNKVSDFFGDIKNVQGVIGLITTGVGIVGQLITGLITANAETQKAIKAAANAKANYVMDAELTAFQKKIDMMKNAGLDTSDLESAQAEGVAQSSLTKLKQSTATYAVDKNFKTKVTGNFDPVYAKKMIDSGIPQPAELVAQMQEYDRIMDTLDKSKVAIEENRRQKQMSLEKEHYDRLADTRIQIAAATEDKLDDIQAAADKERQDTQIKYLMDMLKLMSAGLSPDEFSKQLGSLNGNYNATLAGQDKKTGQQKRALASENARFELDAVASHQNAINALKEDGYIKDRESMMNARDQEGLALAADMMKYEENTKEWIALKNKKADAWISANEKIRKSDEENDKQRTRDLNNAKGAAAVAMAKRTTSGLDDAIVGGQNTLQDLLNQEADERKKAIANYGQDQSVLTAISEKYAALRAGNEQDSQKSAFEAIRKDYEDLEQRQLVGQLHPLQMILDKENERVKTLQKANDELAHSLKLIDERYEKENKAFDKRDKSEFEAKQAALDLAPQLQAGIEHIANEDIINGKITNRTSVGTQVRGLLQLLDNQSKLATAKHDEEGYSSTDSNQNDISFAQEMSDIAVTRAKALKAAQLATKTVTQPNHTTKEVPLTAEERADLEVQYAAAYKQYQEFQKKILSAKQATEKEGKEETVKANDEQIDSGWALVSETQTQMDNLQRIYDTKMKGVSNAFLVAGGSSDILLQKLKQWAPELAQSSVAALGYINNIKNALNLPVTGTPVGNLPGSPAYTGPARMASGGNGYNITDGTYWYKTTSDMYAASTHMAEGGEIPPGYEDDSFPLRPGVKVKSGELITPSPITAQLKNFLMRQNTPMAMPHGPQMIDNSVHIGRVDNNADIDRLGRMLESKGRGNTQGVKRWGINTLSRT